MSGGLKAGQCPGPTVRPVSARAAHPPSPRTRPSPGGGAGAAPATTPANCRIAKSRGKTPWFAATKMPKAVTRALEMAAVMAASGQFKSWPRRAAATGALEEYWRVTWARAPAQPLSSRAMAPARSAVELVGERLRTVAPSESGCPRWAARRATKVLGLGGNPSRSSSRHGPHHFRSPANCFIPVPYGYRPFTTAQGWLATEMCPRITESERKAWRLCPASPVVSDVALGTPSCSSRPRRKVCLIGGAAFLCDEGSHCGRVHEGRMAGSLGGAGKLAEGRALRCEPAVELRSQGFKQGRFGLCQRRGGLRRD